MFRNLAAALMAALACGLFAGCSTGVAPCRFAVGHNTAYGGVNLMAEASDFTGGFSLGDSVDLRFSTGASFPDVPVYDGYYARRGEMLVVCRGRQVRIQRNSGADVFVECGLADDESPFVDVKLNERGRYLVRQKKLRLTYSDERADYASDAVFANFRAMKGGNLAGGLVYRGASPCIDRHGRASFASGLMSSAGVKFVIDLADSADVLKKSYGDATLNAPYWKKLYAEGAVLPFPVQVDYASVEYRSGIVGAMCAIARHEGPFYVHCLEGKDRTGFACLLIGALAGFTNDELVADCMETFRNYYGVSEKDDPERYALVLDQYIGQMVEYLVGKPLADCGDGEVGRAARKYLADGGMADGEIEALVSRLAGK